MNRIQLPGWKLEASAASDLRESEPLPSESACGVARHILFGPQSYEPNYAYPLLVWLHGARDDERQLAEVMKWVSLRNYVAVGPRGTCRSHDDAAGFHWGHSASATQQAERAIYESLQVAQRRYHVNADKVFLAGYGSGGTMALRVGLRNPELFAGVAALNGSFPRGHRPLVALSRLRGLKLLLAHGRESTAYSTSELCADLRLFHAANLAVAVRQYPCGDELRTPMLHDLNVWMMELVTGQTIASAAHDSSSDDARPACEAN